MTQEDYCSYEVAKLLKEKGLEDYGFSCIIHKDGIKSFTHQIVLKWLREEHDIAVVIKPEWAEGDMRNLLRWRWEIMGLKITKYDYTGLLCQTYEEAVEAAIKYTLENLI